MGGLQIPSTAKGLPEALPSTPEAMPPDLAGMMQGTTAYERDLPRKHTQPGKVITITSSFTRSTSRSGEAGLVPLTRAELSTP